MKCFLSKYVIWGLCFGNFMLSVFGLVRAFNVYPEGGGEQGLEGAFVVLASGVFVGLVECNGSLFFSSQPVVHHAFWYC